MKIKFSKNLWLAIGCLCLMTTVGCGNKTSPSGQASAPANAVSTTDFAKTNFTALTEGETSVESSLDWDNFQSSGTNVGEIYAKMPDETQKSAFRKSFIEGFSKSFKGTGAQASDVSNWRVESETPEKAVVLGTIGNGKTIEVTVSKSGGAQKISRLEVR